jgi:mevalonate kinase
MSRTVSSSASAPGKLILFGEHAVVYGEPAVAVALSDLRIQVDATTRDDGVVVIHMPDLKPSSLYYKTDAATLCIINPPCQEPPSSQDAERITDIIRSSSFIELTHECITALTPVVYLLNLLVPSLLSAQSGITIHITSHSLPSGAGLGSSAAFGVSCAAALLQLQQRLGSTTTDIPWTQPSNPDLNTMNSLSLDGTPSEWKKPSSPDLNTMNSLSLDGTHSEWKKPSSPDLNTINSLSFYSELLIHGTPSGIDNAVSTFGGSVFFQKNMIDSTVTMDTLSIPPLSIILTNTHILRSTKLLVAKVRSLKDSLPSTVNPIISAIGSVSRKFRDMISSLEESENRTTLDESLISNMIQINQNLLCALGVSHKCINIICQKTSDLFDDFKCTTKLTGAGGGGCVFTFVEHGSEEKPSEFQTRLHQVQHAIESISDGEDSFKFECLLSSIGNHGVLWC